MKRIALCIGNDDYSFLSKLNCAANDATAISEALHNLGFEVSLKCNLNRNELVNCIVEFCTLLSDYEVGLLYYAGHGFHCDSDNILAPIDLNIMNRPEQVRMESFPLSELMLQMGKSVETTKIIILDSCRENLGYRGAFRDFSPMTAPKGSIIAFSTSPGQTARENISSGHGKYTETILRYISLPRVPIETVFKKVREQLVAETGGGQIPWEHTSLIGDVYLNPDSIFDGLEYGEYALADVNFRFGIGSQIKAIVERLKSYDWYSQERAVRIIKTVNFNDASSSELFVLGRNITQAAEGGCFAASGFIDSLDKNTTIPQEAKIHILNGLSFEVYFDKNNVLRSNYKLKALNDVIRLLETDEFHSSREFISRMLITFASDRLIYIPGQNEIMDIIIKTRKQINEKAIETGKLMIETISCKGKTVYQEDDKDSMLSYSSMGKNQLETHIKSIIAAVSGSVRFQYSPSIDSKALILVPDLGFDLKYRD